MFRINKLLIIDDDRLTREPSILDYWSRISKQNIYPHVWYSFFPRELLNILLTQDINCISLDNDLGDIGTVSQELSKLAWKETDDFERAFKNKKVVIHSMNNVASVNIKNLLSNFCNDVSIYPFGDMLK